MSDTLIRRPHLLDEMTELLGRDPAGFDAVIAHADQLQDSGLPRVTAVRRALAAHRDKDRTGQV